MIFHNRFVSHDELVRVPLRRGPLHHALPQAGADHVGHAGLRRGRGKAVISTPYPTRASCSPTGAGALVPWRDGRAIGREVSRCSATTPRRLAMRAKAATTAKRMPGPRWRGRTSSVFERARTTRSASAALPGRLDPPARPAACPRSTSPTCADERRHGDLAARAFDVPRYDDGYCVDDNARGPAADDAAGRGRRRAPSEITRRSRRGTSPSSATPSTIHSGRFKNFSRTRASGPRASAPRTATGARCGRSARSWVAPRTRGAQPGGRAVSAGCPRRRRSEPPRRGPIRCSASTSTAAFQGETQGAVRCAPRSRSALRALSTSGEPPDWPWFEDKA
jgi:hypothetical protein